MGWDKAIRGYLSVPAPYIHIRGYLLSAPYRKFGIVNHYTEVQMMFTTLVALMIGVIIGYIWRMTWEGGEMKEMAIEQVEDGCDEIIEQEEEDWDRDCPVDIWRREQEELERERIEREKKMAEEKRVTEERSKEEGGANTAVVEAKSSGAGKSGGQRQQAATTSGGTCGGGVRERRERICFRCRKEGHLAINCTREKRCYRCGSKAHLASDCP